MGARTEHLPFAEGLAMCGLLPPLGGAVLKVIIMLCLGASRIVDLARRPNRVVYFYSMLPIIHVSDTVGRVLRLARICTG